MPVDTASAQQMGWNQYNSTCDPMLGTRWSLDPSGPTESQPTTLFFTAGGQVSGIGVTAYGDLSQNLIDQGFWQQTGDATYFLSVTFRDSGMCDGSMSPDTLGQNLTVNANSIAFSVPTTVEDADADSWVAGSCISTMGFHYFYDLSTPGQMSWEAANLLPVVPMFNGSNVNAIFFASPVVQQSLLNRNMWDGLPLPDIAMCLNWCDSSCTWGDTDFWSTMHIFMNDYSTVSCPGDCSFHCCP